MSYDAPDTAIRAENLGKLYRIGEARTKTRYRTLRDTLSLRIASPGQWFRKTNLSKDQDTIWALKDVSFEVKRGEVVGVIGPNGAGKSTLLKILSRITEPTEGVVDIYGRVGCLLEVGTGFHPELTGGENIYLNGAILGMKRKEIERKFDEIVCFAEVEKFIGTPVKHFSSGMYLRLAFAVAAHLEPGILLVDEVLAVGDADFQKKCLGRMGQVAKEGRTVLFVSHNLAAVAALTTRSFLLHRGQVIQDGLTADTIQGYLSLLDRVKSFHSEEKDQNTRSEGSSCLESIKILNDEDSETTTIGIGSDLKLRIGGMVSGSERMEIAISFCNTLGICAFTVTSQPIGGQFVRRMGRFVVECIIPEIRLTEGRYLIRVALYVFGKLREEMDPAGYVDIVDTGLLGSRSPLVAQRGLIAQKSEWAYEIMNTGAG